jgi:hypothetical protein
MQDVLWFALGCDVQRACRGCEVMLQRTKLSRSESEKSINLKLPQRAGALNHDEVSN